METIEQLEKAINAEKAILDLAKEGVSLSVRLHNGEYFYWVFEVIKSKNRLAQLNKALENLKSKSVVVEIKFPLATNQSDVDDIVCQIKQIINKRHIELVIK